MSYDPKCRELAEHFLGTRPAVNRLVAELAQIIQDDVELWIAGERDRIEASQPPTIDDGIPF